MVDGIFTSYPLIWIAIRFRGSFENFRIQADGGRSRPPPRAGATASPTRTRASAGTSPASGRLPGSTSAPPAATSSRSPHAPARWRDGIAIAIATDTKQGLEPFAWRHAAGRGYAGASKKAQQQLAGAGAGGGKQEGIGGGDSTPALAMQGRSRSQQHRATDRPGSKMEEHDLEQFQ
ncbi:hypothetical protein GQ55_1G035100 [Panicum hallii var. hallii]|uniref:Uncharacterized protein n=1 Tax=Panicum hallii var. hallii TaxID=1504633 RepID=A0A2T7F1V9_9POAL|nr:hypothetical protein GQ55_1G035100 [Panicum hallii var. hallii]